MTKLNEYKTVTDDAKIEQELWQEHGELFGEILDAGFPKQYEQLITYMVKCKKSSEWHRQNIEKIQSLMGK